MVPYKNKETIVNIDIKKCPYYQYVKKHIRLIDWENASDYLLLNLYKYLTQALTVIHENHIEDKQFLYDMGETMYHAAVYHDIYGMSFVGEKEFHKEWQEINDLIEADKYKEAIDLAAEPIDYPEIPYEIFFII